MMNARELLKQRGRQPVKMDISSSVEDAIRTFHAEKTSAVLVTVNGRIAGIFTERDVVRCYVGRPGVAFSAMKLGDVMTRNLMIVDITDDLCVIMSIMVQKNIRHIPVAEQGAVAGMLSIMDIVQAQVKNLRGEIHNLQDYIIELHDLQSEYDK
jgi:signal-transduction protein with cAMP-binding, CBS, and nucleotidyltransferase domain